MRKVVSIALVGTAVALFSTSAAMASVISFASHGGGGGQTCYGNAGSAVVDIDEGGMPTNLGGGGGCVQITPHDLWKPGSQANLFGPDDTRPSELEIDPVWISFANTGVNGDTLATPVNNSDTSRPNMVVTQSFHLDTDGFASLRQWADDTVVVLIDGLGLSGADTANFAQDICAAGSPGCQQGESSFGEIALAAGDHVFTWLVWQVGGGGETNSNPFGLLYIGQVTQRDQAVPEPGAFALLGLGLVSFAGLARRKAAVTA